jgi:pimeloyl-ACP methyl ester carboxylesterase
MKFKRCKIQVHLAFIAAGTCLGLFAGCATTPQQVSGHQYAPAANIVRQARSSQVPAETRAADYLQAAAMTDPLLGKGTEPTPARDTYNAAAAELTILLRSADGGRLWNHPLTVTNGSATYHLRLQPASYAAWSPDYFTSFKLASSLEAKKGKYVKTPIEISGVGGALVGVRLVTPPEDFAPERGISAPVTATLDFHGRDATLALRRPARQPTARVEGAVRPLAANYSAPLLYHKHINETLIGLQGAFAINHFSGPKGLRFLQPYDPDRIPIVFVHGLMSTDQMWLNVINGLEADPVLRERYQYWEFGYPTGNPIAYSALRFREALAKVDKSYPNHLGYVLIGHSLGGVVSQMQVTTLNRENWELTVGEPARKVFATIRPGSLAHRGLVFKANPRIKRVIFVCAPHLGSKLAISPIAELGMRLITLPSHVAATINNSVGKELEEARVMPDRPNVVSGLAPDSPTLKTMATVPVQAPYHSIIGNRGKPGPLIDSSDGVVGYRSSHLAKAESEVIVPGPHGLVDYRQTIAELKRILHLHLKATATSKPAVTQMQPALLRLSAITSQ